MKLSFKVQAFATDIDSHGIAHGPSRPFSALASLWTFHLRLARFIAEETVPPIAFNKSHPRLAGLLEQNVAKDPPFSKLDFISCRNLLIYMSGELAEEDLSSCSTMR